jgi:hypothetical protein
MLLDEIVNEKYEMRNGKSFSDELSQTSQGQAGMPVLQKK